MQTPWGTGQQHRARPPGALLRLVEHASAPALLLLASLLLCAAACLRLALVMDAQAEALSVCFCDKSQRMASFCRVSLLSEGVPLACQSGLEVSCLPAVTRRRGLVEAICRCWTPPPSRSQWPVVPIREPEESEAIHAGAYVDVGSISQDRHPHSSIRIPPLPEYGEYGTSLFE